MSHLSLATLHISSLSNSITFQILHYFPVPIKHLHSLPLTLYTSSKRREDHGRLIETRKKKDSRKPQLPSHRHHSHQVNPKSSAQKNLNNSLPASTLNQFLPQVEWRTVSRNQSAKHHNPDHRAYPDQCEAITSERISAGTKEEIRTNL